MNLLEFYRGKKVLVTGHTGFKGTWLCKMLLMAGAEVTGYSTEPPTEPSLFKLSNMQGQMNSITGDVRDLAHLLQVMENTQPELVFHLAAQPIVRDSYKNPVHTYETNVMGTVNILESIRRTDSVKSFLNVTTDKVYYNHEWPWGYRETDPLDGFDPYSNSKSCSELVTHSYKNSFFGEGIPAISTARAGNVIGGGDFANDRIIPDCIRAAMAGQAIQVRNPYSTRPFQHVLEPLTAYLLIAARQYEDESVSGYYNVGPEDGDCVAAGDLARMFCEAWQEGLTWENRPVEGPHEANFLKLDCSKIKFVLGWKPRWNIEKAVKKTVEWTKAWLAHEDVNHVMEKQIEQFMRGFRGHEHV